MDLQKPLPRPAEDVCKVTLCITQEGLRKSNFFVVIEKEVPIPSFTLSSPSQATSSKTMKAKPIHDAERDKLPLSPQI